MAASMEELLMQYKAQQAEAEARAKKLQEANTVSSAIGSSSLGAVGAIAAPIAANFLTEVFGLNKRSAGESAAMAGLQNVAQGGTTQAQAGINYARSQAQSRLAGEAARGTAQQQASAQRQAMRIGQEGQAQFAAQLADKRAQEQEQAMRAVASMEKQYADEQRRRTGMMVAGSIEGGLGALSKAYGGYLANKQRVQDLTSQAEGAGAALGMIGEMSKLRQPTAPAPVVAPVPVASPEPVALQEEASAQDRIPLFGQQPQKPSIKVGELKLQTKPISPGILNSITAADDALKKRIAGGTSSYRTPYGVGK